MPPAIPSSALVSRRSQHLTNDLSGTESVMLDIDRGRYFGLQDVGKVVWEQLDTPATLDDLCRHLVTRFEVDIDTCRRDIGAFLEQLLAHGLIEVSDADGAS